MPIYEAPGADVKAPEAAKVEAPKVYVCTLADSDSGEDCRYCRRPSGSGHGKARG